MPNGFGRGGGYGRRFGFRGISPPWPYVGRGRGGLPRCGYFIGGAGLPVSWFYQAPASYPGMSVALGYTPYAPAMSREGELNYMKDQAEVIKRQLEEIEARMQDLEEEK